MTLANRPNYQALDDALAIYRDEMRPFIIRNLKRVPGKDVETAIKAALRDASYNQYEANRQSGLSVDDALDIGDFLPLVRAYWRDGFRDAFVRKDNVYARMDAIAKSRNLVAHPKSDDMDFDYAIEGLDDIAEMLAAINQPEQSDAVKVIKSRLLPLFKIHAHKFRQGGRDVFAFPLDLETLNRTLPNRVDDRVIRDANRPLTQRHAKDIQEYLENRRDWLLGTLLLGVHPDAIEFQSYMPDSHAEMEVGELTINAEGVAGMKMFDGQHRRRAIKDILYELSHNAQYSKLLRELKSESLPIMLYAEADINALQQMFADAARARPIEANTVTLFDQHDAFNITALRLEEESMLFNKRVEMNSASVARKNPNIVSINQLARILKILEVGYGGRVRKERNDAYMLELDSLYERCLEWSDDFMPAARDEYNDLMSGEIEDSEIPQKRAETLAYNALMIRVLAACYREMKDNPDWRPLAELLNSSSLRPGVHEGLLVDSGLLAPGGTLPIAQQQVVLKAIDYIIGQVPDGLGF